MYEGLTQKQRRYEFNYWFRNVLIPAARLRKLGRDLGIDLAAWDQRIGVMTDRRGKQVIRVASRDHDTIAIALEFAKEIRGRGVDHMTEDTNLRLTHEDKEYPVQQRRPLIVVDYREGVPCPECGNDTGEVLRKFHGSRPQTESEEVVHTDIRGKVILDGGHPIVGPFGTSTRYHRQVKQLCCWKHSQLVVREIALPACDNSVHGRADHTLHDTHGVRKRPHSRLFGDRTGLDVSADAEYDLLMDRALDCRGPAPDGFTP